MCTGRVDLSHLLRAFWRGADGVFIVGCRLGECNYITHGNYHAVSTVGLCKKIMERIGLRPGRLMIELMSGGEGVFFAEVMNAFGRKVKEIGPLGQSEGMEKQALQAKLEAVTRLVPYIRLVESQRLRIVFESVDACEQWYADEAFNRLFEELIAEPIAVSRITSLLRAGPRSTGEIAGYLGLYPADVTRHLDRSVRQGWVRFDEAQERYSPAGGE